jgi:DNA-binding CsgD family transcriptional regulator
MIGKGAKSQEIDTALKISKLTVDTHRENITHKLQTSGSIKAYDKARDIGLI